MTTKTRRWCITSFEADMPKIDEKFINYSICGKEVCPSTGKQHWQCYFEFKNPRAFSGIQKTFPGSHIEVAKGNGSSNQKYCSKEGNFIEVGALSTQGERTDINTVTLMIKDNKSLIDIIDAAPVEVIKFNRGIKLLIDERDKHLRQKDRIITVKVYTGPSGCGKTRLARTESPNYMFTPTTRSYWFDGYDGEVVLILDEFNSDNMPYEELLSLLDRYPKRLPIKGGFTYAAWTTVIITSNIPIASWYWDRPNRSALDRRITSIKNLWPTGTDVSGTEVVGNTIDHFHDGS